MQFDLLNSLMGVNENQQPPTPHAAPSEPQATVEITEVLDSDQFKESGWNKDYTTYSAKFSLGVKYTEPNGSALELYVNTTLSYEFSIDDDSFDYEYGSIRGTHGGVHGVISYSEFSNTEIPREEENYDFYKLPPEQVSRIGNLIINHINNMKEEEVEKYYDVDSESSDRFREYQKKYSRD